MKAPKLRTAIFGTGGMGREVADLCRRAGLSELVFVQDAPSGPVDGIEVISPSDVGPDDRLVLALGSSADRRRVSQRFETQSFGNVVSKTAIVSGSANVGPGVILSDYSLINSRSVIGKHFQANVFSHVSHDCVIGDFVTLSPRVSCNGWVHIEDDVFVGAGAIIRNGSPERRLSIGRGAVIGMGAVVTRDVPPMSTVIGLPAKARDEG